MRRFQRFCFRPLFDTVPEEVLGVLVHCFVECEKRFPRFRSTFYRVPEEVPEVPVHYRVVEEVPEVPVQCIRRFWRFPYIVLYSTRRGSGGSGPVCFTMPEEVPEVAVHCVIQCQMRLRRFRSTVLYSARGGSRGSGPLS